MGRIISADELCDCPDDPSVNRELCSDDCKHRHPWGTGKSLLERYQAQHNHEHTMEDADMVGESSVWPCGHSVKWVTMTSHPASGLRYQTVTVNQRTYGRVTQGGHELVSPAPDNDSLYRQYVTRVNRAIDE